MTATKFAILLALVAAVNARSPGHHAYRRSIGSRIVNGQDTSIEDIPYQVSLSLRIWGRITHYCGGIIISENWILTAAHCQNYPNDWFFIRAGSTSVSSGGSVHEIASFISHEDFYEDVHGIPRDDIALIQVATPFTLDATRAIISMFNAGEEAVPGTLALVSGWGLLGFSPSLPDTLQSVTVPILSKDYCSAANSGRTAYDKEICIDAASTGQGSCTADSGGPLAIDGRLAGIVSWGLVCGETPSVFVEVASYRGWIAQQSGL